MASPEKVLRYNKFYIPEGTAVFPNDTKLQDAVLTEADNRLRRMAEVSSDEVIKATKPSVDTILVPPDVPFERMAWKLPNGEIKSLSWMEKFDLLCVVKDLIARISQLQKMVEDRDEKLKISPAEQITQRALGLL